MDALSAEPSATESLGTLADQSAPLLASAKDLVSDISAQYSDPAAMLQADAMVIDISGRQRMLIQRMSKNICLVTSNITLDASKQELDETIQVFEATLMALRAGMPEAGIKSPPNAQVADGLSVVANDWVGMKPKVTALLSGKALSTQERASIYHGMNQLTADMNKVVGLYAEASKLGGM